MKQFKTFYLGAGVLFESIIKSSFSSFLPVPAIPGFVPPHARHVKVVAGAIAFPCDASPVLNDAGAFYLAILLGY